MKGGLAYANALRWLAILVVVSLLSWAAPSFAATCSPAASQGSAPASWQSYCWLDFSGYDDAAARSASGQNYSASLSDGSVISFNLKASSTAATALSAVAAPSWTGSAVGNVAFLGIPNKPILYTSNGGSTVVITISGIAITPPTGGTASTYAFVAADAESTNDSEQLSFTTNGSNWTVLDQVAPISGSTYPTTSNTGSTFTETGTGGTVGGYIVGSNTPTTVSARLVGQGLQGVMFAVRFASIKVNDVLVGTRLAAADQFTFGIRATGSGNLLSTGTSAGTGNGPYTAVAVEFAAGLSVTLSDVMAAGSASAIASYPTTLTCTNAASGSPTAMPTNLATTSYQFGTLAFGDAVNCTFTSAPVPRLTLAKALGGARVFAGDQFTLTITQAGTIVATATTNGTGAAVTGSASFTAQGGTAYALAEAASGSTVLSYYTAGIACTNTLSGSSTALPSTFPAAVTPANGDNITCTITNTPKPSTANLIVVKASAVVSDPVNGTTNPKLIPGAILRYSITVSNAGTAAVDAGSLVLLDVLPTTVNFSASGQAVQFVDGATPSGLTFSTGNVGYSKQAGGGTPYTYTPTADASGFDTAVKAVRVNPTGTMAGATASHQPSFTVQFYARVN